MSDMAKLLWWVIGVITTMTIAFLLLVPPAGSATSDPRLDSFASKFAMRPVEVRCMEKTEKDSPWGYGAWGYVMKPTGKAKWTAVDSRLCMGALSVNDEGLPEWQRALGVAVLTHESYHLRRWGGNQNEAKAECQAIRHFRVAARLLGATEETVEDLFPTALALHYRLTQFYDPWTKSQPYFDPTCEVPGVIPPEVLEG